MYTILFIHNTFFYIYKGIESLPYDLQRNFSLQRDLDQRAHGKFSFHIIEIFLLPIHLLRVLKTEFCKMEVLSTNSTNILFRETFSISNTSLQICSPLL